MSESYDLAGITFGLTDPLNKIAFLPGGEISVSVSAYDPQLIHYSSLGLTPNSLSGAVMTSAWQVDAFNVVGNITVTSLDNISGILEVSAMNIWHQELLGSDSDYTFITQTSATPPVIIISNDPATKIIDPDPVIVTVQVISPGYNDLQSFGLLENSVGTIISAGITNPYIPYPNSTYIISISATGNLMVSANDIYENNVSATDGIYVNYTNEKVCEGKELNLVNFLPNHLKVGEVGTFIKFFEDFLNNMYYCNNSYRDDSTKQTDEYKISILEKIYRLSTLHDVDTIDMDYIQFFASYLGYNININRGDLGNLASTDLTSINTNGIDPDVDISDSEVSQRYLRFAIRNLPTWYRIKTTRNAIKVMLFSFGLVGDILTNYTAPIESGGYTNDETKWLTYDDSYLDSSLISQIPSNYFNTPHFSIAVDYDNSPVNWFKQLPMILDAIESIRPINTVLDEIAAVIKRKIEPITIRTTSRINSTRYFSGAYIPEPSHTNSIIDEYNNIFIDDLNNNIIHS